MSLYSLTAFPCTAGGEALYRLAIDPSPKKRYILNEQRSLNFSEYPILYNSTGL
jgi:hypothetical protein